MKLEDEPIAAKVPGSGRHPPQSVWLRHPHDRDNPAKRRRVVAAGLALLTPRLLLAIGIGAAILTLALSYFEYLGLGAYLDHIEGPTLVNGWQYLVDGMDLYQLEDGVPRFATYYGPLTYLTIALGPFLFGATVTISKLAPIVAACITLAVMAAYFFRRRTVSQAFHGFFLIVAGLVTFVPASFWMRPDPFETLLVALAVVSTAHPIAIGIFIGLAVNFKVHAFVYFLPILAEMGFDRRWRGLLVAATTASLVFLLPFLAPGISLHDYIVGLHQQVGDRRVYLVYLLRSAPPAALLALPLILMLAARQEARDRLYAVTALFVLLLLVYPASFPGAGGYHFLPLVPVLADAYSRSRPHEKATKWVILAFFLFASPRVADIFDLMAAKRDWGLVADEALALARESPTRSVQIGYGDSQRGYDISELNRTVLSMNAAPALIDGQVLMELQPIGVDGSARWVPYLTQCRIKRWLMPRNEAPFAITNFFYAGGPIFDAEFRRAFSDHYRLVSSTQYFDIWDCAGS